MEKIKVSKEEFDALNLFVKSYDKESFEEKLKTYLDYSSFWIDNSYLPLKDMGFEKFAKCLIQGYEILFDDTKQLKLDIGMDGLLDISYNTDYPALKTIDDPIYIGIKNTNSHCLSLGLEETKKVINILTELVEQLEEVEE